MLLVNKNTGKVLADEVEVMDSFWSRLRGLMFRLSFEDGEALLFEFPEPRKFRVHTFFVFFPIDLAYLNGNLEVLETEGELSPWRVYSPDSKARFLIELPKGTISELEVEVGDELEFREA